MCVNVCKFPQYTGLEFVSLISLNDFADQSSLRDFIEIYAKSRWRAASNNSFIYIDISNLCDGARARVHFENVHRGTWLVLTAMRCARNVLSDARQHVRDTEHLASVSKAFTRARKLLLSIESKNKIVRRLSRRDNRESLLRP